MYDVILVVLPTDINECKSGRNTCANDTVCFNLDGGYDCRCPHGHNCTGDCIHDNKVKHSGQIWVLDSDRCSVCSCQVRNRGRWTQRQKQRRMDWMKQTGGKMEKCGVMMFPVSATACAPNWFMIAFSVLCLFLLPYPSFWTNNNKSKACSSLWKMSSPTVSIRNQCSLGLSCNHTAPLETVRGIKMIYIEVQQCKRWWVRVIIFLLRHDLINVMPVWINTILTHHF